MMMPLNRPRRPLQILIHLLFSFVRRNVVVQSRCSYDKQPENEPWTVNGWRSVNKMVTDWKNEAWFPSRARIFYFAAFWTLYSEGKETAEWKRLAAIWCRVQEHAELISTPITCFRCIVVGHRRIFALYLLESIINILIGKANSYADGNINPGRVT